MIILTFTVDDINTVMQIYNQIQIQRSESQTGTFSDIGGLGPVVLTSGQTTYELIDAAGLSTYWYRSRYYSTSSFTASAWFTRTPEGLFYSPLYPAEVSYSTAEHLVINRIRRLIGDPISIRRDSGEEYTGHIHFDNKTYELYEKGWPLVITIAGTNYNQLSNPTVDGYRYLRFSNDISTVSTVSGIDYGIDIWYNNFRHSDREIMDAFDSSTPPSPLTSTTATSEAYMLQTSIDLLRRELWEDATEDGASIRDEGSSYNPAEGQKIRKQLLDNLQDRLDKLVKSLMLTGISGVLID